MGGVSLQAGRQGRAELADTHLNQTKGKQDGHVPMPSFQVDRGQALSEFQTAGDSGPTGTGTLEPTAPSQQIVPGLATLFTGPATGFPMVFPEAAVLWPLPTVY